jgi:L-2-hydroxyglutarate oxidase
VVVLEAESGLARHQTGHNSGVIHSGLYYKPGSLKALNCTVGREAMYRFCAEQGVDPRALRQARGRHGKELPALNELERRGRANGLDGMIRLSQGELRNMNRTSRESRPCGCRTTGIVDFPGVTEAYARLVRRRAARCAPAPRGPMSTATARAGGGNRRGPVRARHLINCAGLQSDRIARLCGLDPGVQIIPFRGEYYELVPEQHHLVRNLIYPVPDPRFPFLGVHFTRMVKGGVEAGPNAVLAFRREGYDKLDFSLRDSVDMAASPASGAWLGNSGRPRRASSIARSARRPSSPRCKNSCRPSGPIISNPAAPGCARRR